MLRRVAARPPPRTRRQAAFAYQRAAGTGAWLRSPRGFGASSRARSATRRMTLERQCQQAIDELLVAGPSRLDELGKRARGAEARHRVDLVDQWAAVGQEEIHAGKAL